jgi:hypothetical protein
VTTKHQRLLDALHGSGREEQQTERKEGHDVTTATKDDVYQEIRSNAIKLFPTDTPEQAVEKYLRDHQMEYQRYSDAPTESPPVKKSAPTPPAGANFADRINSLAEEIVKRGGLDKTEAIAQVLASEEGQQLRARYMYSAHPAAFFREVTRGD